MATREWLEADGLGGFASGTAELRRTRRYHALLLAAARPPGARYVLVSGFDARVTTASGTYAISSQQYAPGVIHPDGARSIDRFAIDPWPRWLFRLPDGTYLTQELFAVHGAAIVAVSFRLLDANRGARLDVRPFLAGRDLHALHHENAAIELTPAADGQRLTWRTYATVPEITVLANGSYRHAPDWYRRFEYEEEAARGLDHLEDLATPGELTYDLGAGEAIFIAAAATPGDPELLGALRLDAAGALDVLRRRERTRRASFPSRLHRSADAFVVARGTGKTIIAGYPWFGDWGRDTFIALRGLCLATGRLDDAASILREWSGLVSAGMLPNRFADDGAAEYNSIDAGLWFAVAAGELLQALAGQDRELKTLHDAIEAIVDGCARGTRHGVRLDGDGLLAAGVRGVQLTWMDAKVGGWVVTPRAGKPVEVQALWLNALRFARGFTDRWLDAESRGLAAFRARFPDPASGGLFDVVDPDGVAGTTDASFRPNQIFAAGGLPFPIVEGRLARTMVDRVEQRLLTPLGLRSLAPDDGRYIGRYEGGVRERDGAYHQGTVWPWLLGPFIEAWVRTRGGTREAKAGARARFMEPLLQHLDDAGLGHVSEICDGDEPYTPRGCPFQAWSLAELLRLVEGVLAS